MVIPETTVTDTEMATEADTEAQQSLEADMVPNTRITDQAGEALGEDHLCDDEMTLPRLETPPDSEELLEDEVNAEKSHW